MTTLLALVEGARAYGLRAAIVDRLKAEYPEVQVKSWPGKLDVSEMVEKTNINPPAILVAVTELQPPDQRIAGQHHRPVAVTAYVVAEDRPLGPERRVYRGDEIALALCDGLLWFLETPAARWGIADVDHPDEARAQPVLTLAGLKEGTAYFAVTWRQTLYGLGVPLDPASEGPLLPPPFGPGPYPPGTDIRLGTGAVAE